MNLILYTGISLIGIGISLYIAHAIIYNYFLRKNSPEIFNDIPQSGRSKKQKKKMTIAVINSQTPSWVVLLGLPSIPLFLVGVLMSVVALIMKIF